jgi:GT2 family glycosyltransferase
VSATVAVVVLTWNGREDTLACLASLRNVEHEPLVVIVVDNASTDGTAEAVVAQHPEADLVRNAENLGFAGGMNAGIRRALERGADHVLLLNNDTEVDPPFVSELLDAAAVHPEAGALCSKVLFADAPDRIWFAGAGYDPRRGHQGRQRGYGERDGARYQGTWESDRACGTAMLVPRGVVERVGLLDDELFAYAEDVEWSLRARERGLRIFVAGDSRVWHKVSATSGGEASPTALYYTLRNGLVVAERHAPLGAFGTWRRRLVALAATTAQVLLAGRRRRAALRAVAQGFGDARARRLGPRGGRRGGPPRTPLT